MIFFKTLPFLLLESFNVSPCKLILIPVLIKADSLQCVPKSVFFNHAALQIMERASCSRKQ